ncbi:MAG: class I SAM-dependent methyltransferase [Candidatus Hodarchaeales archaeon]|jgi:ubiquinone/menaquinone biosynthesis C-methylase UbiE
MKRFKPYFKLLFTKAQNITIDTIPNGSVIDIGGGGEGVIAQIGKEKITAIDKYQEEIDEAKSKSPTTKWIVADATDLQFDAEYFDNATIFFSGMYMSSETFEQVCKEVYRVLKNNGEFWIWDTIISDNKELFIIRLSITLPNGKKIRTAYGSRIKDRSLSEIKQNLRNAKFQFEVIETHPKWFFLKAVKEP